MARPAGRASRLAGAAGEKLFQQLACITCHRSDAQGRGPVLEGLFGTPVQLANGETVIADEAYIRESILNPTAKVVAGYQPIMPTFQGQVSEEQVLAAHRVHQIAAARRPARRSSRRRPAATGRRQQDDSLRQLR